MIARASESPRIGRPLSIGPVALRTNLLLAPVANYCDLAFRIVCREASGAGAGLGLACTDLLSPQGLLRGTARSLDLAQTHELDKPICMQLYGGDPEILAQGAVWAVEHGADVIDINMGCPVDKVTKKDGGSKLLCDVANTIAIVRRVVSEVERASRGRVPVTAKLRLGWDDGSIVAPDLARKLEREGIALVTVHGRTTEQKFKGSVRLPGIREVVQAVDAIPVLGNGDVTDVESGLTMMRETGCAGLMIGRGAFSAPWIFRDIWHAQVRGEVLREPSEAEKIAIVRRYLDLMMEFRGEHYAMTHMRRRISWFSKKLGPCKPLKEAVRTAPDPASVHSALDEFLAGGLRMFPAGEPECAESID
ncbi:MAG: tRNA dihydrouridine synthase DusB [Phycisphaeraceae bacterium]|nr:tRNA dihydrouridine synthase DusB [Phycisphaerales bacterium]MCB9842755.1 tRNA dihydrouridine synthase DusB [Phycisphaeraceae bacterium]